MTTEVENKPVESGRTVRPEILQSKTYKIKIQGMDGVIKLFITICDLNGKPYEIFINTKNSDLVEHLSVTMIMVSYMMQKDEPVNEIARRLGEIHSPFTSHFKTGAEGGGSCPSLYARIGEVLLKHVEGSHE